MICPVCHATVVEGSYYCSNCGNNLKPTPPDSSTSKQLSLYLGSVLLPPLGFIWGWKYIRTSNPKLKMIGFVCFGLTLVSLILATTFAIDLITSVNNQIQTQTQTLLGM